MVVFLSKSDASACFDQIVDFLNAHGIQYALVVNLTIYVSCVKQFWASITIKKVAKLEQDKHTQDLEILKLKKRVKKLEKKKKKSRSSGFKRLRKGMIDQDVSVATKDVSAVEPTMFDDEEVTMTMAQTLIKMKDEKAKLLDEQIAQRLYDEEIEKDAAKEKQEKDDLERAKIVGGITKAYQSFEDMLKGFDREDLVALWRLMKEKFSFVVPKEDKEKALWVELTKKDYPLSNAVMIMMLSANLQVEEDNEMARDLVMKSFMDANKPKNKTKVDVVQRLKENAQRDTRCWFDVTAIGLRLMLLGKADTAAEVTKEITLSS
uniref:Uncharacterized protein n=1 Tax=Tanacetum cinerariifolium TaxID=118510 RepID=A0A699HA18_TANCI|nr:hypothetical protein [Tanacetum cinerariifolium]